MQSRHDAAAWRGGALSRCAVSTRRRSSWQAATITATWRAHVHTAHTRSWQPAARAATHLAVVVEEGVPLAKLVVLLLDAVEQVADRGVVRQHQAGDAVGRLDVRRFPRERHLQTKRRFRAVSERAPPGDQTA